VAGRLLLCLARCIGGKGLGEDEIGLGPDLRRRLSGVEVGMPERQHELQPQRKQRQPSTRPDIAPEPLHETTDVTL